VIAQVQKALSDYATHGVQAFLRWEEDRQTLRRNAAELIGAQSTELGFIANTSAGVTDIALSFPWKKGDRVVLFHGEFPANVTPWQRAAELFELELAFLSPDSFLGPEGLTLLRQELERGARVVAVSVVQFQTGQRLPIRALGALCHEFGAHLFVDAIQACGIVPLDVRRDNIDYLATGSHKWLMGCEGAGFLFIRQEHRAALRPFTAGWLSHTHAVDFLFRGAGHLRTDREFREDAAVFEGGTQSVLGLAALGASIPILRELGAAAIFAHVLSYLDVLEAGLLDLGFHSLRAADRESQSSLLCVLPPPDVTTSSLAAQLRERGVIVATPDGKLRFSPHFPNSLSEVPMVLDNVASSLAALRR
jgi:selenocysteine lyase/cysteine desulfurase